jgi:diguanylate cyclase (GGDEF)-like protein/hemerythrin-like metal-binding protein
LAMLDPLLKIYNRNKLDEDMAAIVENSNRMGDTASILLIDLDKFKSINDEYGHDVGDEVLIQATQIITSLLRADDSVYRWGGDEFMVLAPLTDINGAARLAQRINEKFEASVFPKVGELHVSIGCAQHFQHELKENWFKRVDLTLYKAKQTGRNRIEIWANTDLLPATIAKLIWQGVFESGNTEIDRQHKILLRLSNELYDRLGSSDSKADVDEILDRVGTELTNHFNFEYELIKKLKFEEADQHKVIHDELLSEYDQMRTQLHGGTVNLGAFFNFVSVKIIAQHIIKEDSKFFELIKSNQS